MLDWLRRLLGPVQHGTVAPEQRRLFDTATSKAEEEHALNLIVSGVTTYFNVREDRLVSRARDQEIVRARQIAVALMYELLPNMPLHRIGWRLGGRDHSTINYSLRVVEMRVDPQHPKYDPTWGEDIAEIKRRLGQ